MPAYAIVIRGKVQGVYFRDFTRRVALALGVSGHVRNEPDGSVSAVCQHEREPILQAMLCALGSGPPAAAVTGLSWRSIEEDPELSGFEITA